MTTPTPDLRALLAMRPPGLEWPPTVEHREGDSYECPMCGGDGEVEGCTIVDGGVAGIAAADIPDVYGIQCFGVGSGHIEMERYLRALYKAAPALLDRLDALQLVAEKAHAALKGRYDREDVVDEEVESLLAALAALKGTP